ncbi:MAG: hypothetical protein KA243_01045 [Candidatus Aminicenantes bacterium]|nr:hypothetical protein [Candidatus Aminicenantes bacterium]
MSNDPVVLEDGRIPLPPPTPEALAKAAEDVLGPTAPEALFEDGTKLFRGMGSFFLQGPDESAGTAIPHADRDLQEKLMSEAAKCRNAAAESERAKYFDPKTNPMIKFPE